MASSIFAHREYRTYLRSKFEGGHGRGMVTRLAAAVNCQRSHISRVLTGQLHLTLDQAFKVTKFFGLDEFESAYFMKVVEFERAGDAEYRSHLKEEITRLRQAHEDLSNRTKQPSLGQIDREMIYYSSWHWSAIHIVVSIPKYQHSTAIAARLGLTPGFVDSTLTELEKMGLVRKEKGKWHTAGGSTHLSKSSPMNSVQHSNWRVRAVMDSQKESDGVHYTVVQSLSLTDFEKVKHLLLKAIDDYATVAGPSVEEELTCFACDFFRV